MAEIDNRVDTELKIKRIETRAHVLINVSSHLFRFLTIAVLAYFVYMSVDALSGEITDANFIVGLFSDKYFANIICLLVAIGSVFYGRKQSKLRKDVVERYHKYMKNEEEAIDPNRSSSQMDARGENRLEETP